MNETIINGIIEESQEVTGQLQYARGAKGDDGVGISDISKTSTEGKVDTYTITLTDGTTKNFTVTNGDDGANGISVSDASINASGHLIVTLSDGTTIDAGVARDDISNKMNKTNPTGTGSFSLNRKANTAVGKYSFTEGYATEASGSNSHAEGSSTTASGYTSHAEGDGTTASGVASHAEGEYTTASGDYSHAEGGSTTASDDNAHAEGYHTTASADNAHAEGYYTTASGNQSHAEGYYTKALGHQSHAEGGYTTASGYTSHAEGGSTTASGLRSHAEGSSTKASGYSSHAEGGYTTASSDYQHVQGQFNIEDSNNIYADIIGNGSSDTNRSNAATVDWNGNAWYAGDVYVGSTSGTNRDEGSKKLATETEVNQLKKDLVSLDNLLKEIQNILNQGAVVDSITVNEINNMIVNYFENKTVSEVE